MQGLVKTFLIYGLATFIDKLITLFFIPIYAKYFSVEDFGKMEIVLSIISIFSIFAFLQLETSLQRYFYDLKENELKILFSSILLFVLILSLAVVSFVFILSDYLSLLIFSESNSTTLINWGIAQIPFICLYTFSTIMLRFSKDYGVFIKLIIASAILNICLPLYLVFVLNMGLKGYFIAQFISILFLSLLSIIYVRKYFVFEFSKKELYMALCYSLPQFPARIGATVNAYANRFFINAYMDQYSIGIFAMAFKVSSILQVLYQFFLTAWNQIMFELKMRQNHKEILVSIYEIINPLVFLIVSYFCLFSRDILFFLSEKFIEGDYLIGIFSLSHALLLIKEVVDIGPKFLKKTSILSVNFTISVIVNILCLLLFVPLAGLEGAAFSLLLTNAALLILSWYNSNRIFYLRFRKAVILLYSLPCLILILLQYADVMNFSIYLKFIIGVFLLVLYSFGIISWIKRFYVLYAN